MARREWPLLFVCGHEGCNERANYRYATKRDLMESFELKNYSNGRWRCLRHSRPDEVLSAENPETRIVWASEDKGHGRYFGSQGFVSGPGFKVFANDLPPGTKLIVSARIELPASAMSTRSAETEGLRPQDESAVPQADAPKGSAS